MGCRSVSVCEEIKASSHHEWVFLGEIMKRVSNWIVILDYSYLVYSSFDGKTIYRGAVSYDEVVWC